MAHRVVGANPEGTTSKTNEINYIKFTESSFLEGLMKLEWKLPFYLTEAPPPNITTSTTVKGSLGVVDYQIGTFNTTTVQQSLSLFEEENLVLCDEMLSYCLELMNTTTTTTTIGSSSGEKRRRDIRVEFGRVERNKLIKRLLDCVLNQLNLSPPPPPITSGGKAGNNNIELMIKMLDLINVLIDLHRWCANQIGTIDNFEDLNTELTIVNSLISLDFYFLIGMGLQRRDLTGVVYRNILNCIRSVEDFVDYRQSPPPAAALNQFSKRVIDNLMDEGIFRALQGNSNNNLEGCCCKYLIEPTLECLIQCTTTSSLFRMEFSKVIHFERVATKLLRIPFDCGTYKMLGDCSLNHVNLLSLFYRLLSMYLINFVELIQLVDGNLLFEMTDFLLSCCYSNSTASSNDHHCLQLLMDPLIFLYSLSVSSSSPSSGVGLFTPHHVKCFIARIKSLLLLSSSHHTSTTLLKINIISIVRKWMEVYSNHLTNNVNITNLVNEILSQNLPLTIFNQLATSEPSLTLTINSFLSWMISSLNSNDISQIHKFSEFLSVHVLLPFTTTNHPKVILTNSTKPSLMNNSPKSENEQTILNKLLQEPRLIPTLTENNLLSLIENKALTIPDDNIRQLLYETVKEQGKFTSMLNALPPQDKKLLQITEGNLFINKLK